MNIEEAVKRACEKPTLSEALTWICVWESERAVKQARENHGSGADGAGWDTCFRAGIERVLETYADKDLQVEVWECRECGERTPCRLEITFSDVGMPPHLKGRERFCHRICPCTESVPWWTRMPNKECTG